MYHTFLLQSAIALRVITNLCSGVTTIELDDLAAETAATMINQHPDYAVLAARIAISNLHKETKKVFSGERYYRKCQCHTVWSIYDLLSIYVSYRGDS